MSAEHRENDLALSVLKKLADIHTDVEVTKNTVEILKEENDRFRGNIIELFNLNRDTLDKIGANSRVIGILEANQDTLKDRLKSHIDGHWKVTGLVLTLAGMIGGAVSWVWGQLKGD